LPNILSSTDKEHEMIKIVNAADLYRRPVAAASMFKDRAAQFKNRLQWDAVELDDVGLEFDEYDTLNPIYVIAEDEKGEHLGSGRMMPTTGRTMIAEHFSNLTDGTPISSPLIWEITRLCVSPRLAAGDPRARTVPAALLYAGCDLSLRSGVEFCVAVFFKPMYRVFKSVGFAPEIIGEQKYDEGTICAGLWEITPEGRDNLADRAGIAQATDLRYFPNAASFGFDAAAPAVAATSTATTAEPTRLAA
jgi:acyl homoserine lactone synthase